MRIARLMRWVAAGVLVLSASFAHAQATPDATVKAAYAATIRSLASTGPKAAPPPWRPPHRDKLMSKGLAALFARDDLYSEESGEMGHVDADPFISGQDGEVKSLRVSVTEPPANGRALVTASFLSFKSPVSVRFRMVEEGGSWRIDDIVNRVEGKDYAVRESLSQPYECGSFMKKPCKK
ncbi:DUF3828 domain-containing protein [Bosea caraganae]|uniref:DUF3828 domain-containing protein n=1 Tax=Bosea caraganae TaxID=2763117 RepID=A0A370KY27_9HYPH|nr:DUF3828 domain-containing protein [Bosea caraganae]RDJ19881.1 DUF3828 domain-containing protein [Bosea caraganae]RDJ25611.1 DUF3828 domain-containing protein [Bosea caraganae]